MKTKLPEPIEPGEVDWTKEVTFVVENKRKYFVVDEYDRPYFKGYSKRVAERKAKALSRIFPNEGFYVVSVECSKIFMHQTDEY